MDTKIQDKNVSSVSEAVQTKKPFTSPKLTFVEPKLTKQGDATEITSGFLGPFSPN